MQFFMSDEAWQEKQLWLEDVEGLKTLAEQEGGLDAYMTYR